MCLPVKEALTDLILQGFDLAAQGGLRQKNPFCSPADVSILGHGHKMAELSQFHAMEHTCGAV